MSKLLYYNIDSPAINIPDIYFSAGYHKIWEKNTDDGIPKIVIFEDENLGKVYYPFMLRPCSVFKSSEEYNDVYEAISNYGYGGPILDDVAEKDRDKIIELFRAELEVLFKKNDIITELTRFHSLIKNYELFQNSDLIELMRDKSTIYMKIDAEAEILDNMSVSTRNQVRQSLKNDLNIKYIKNPDLEQIKEFYQIYKHNMEAVNAAEYYLFNLHFFVDTFDYLNDNAELAFEHDLSNADKKMIQDSIDLVNTQSKDFFETTIDEFNATKIKLSALTNTLNKVDADLEDDIILEYNSKKEKADFQLSEANQQIGENKANISKEEMNVKRLNQSYQDLLKKVEINKKNKTKIAKSAEYLDVLKKFVFEQKEQKKESLAKNILEEMQKLMHKLKTSGSQFVSDIKVTILAEGNGMKITLYNPDDEEIKKEVLSQGEKQLYISSLIKAILKESIQSLPIFIDTPLGRLDDEHIKNILLYYYPDLSEQVVILSTNNEITPKRFKDISESVSKSYLLVNDGINTKLKKGYFHSYED
jgi:DNA sulfur modification protein DndD